MCIFYPFYGKLHEDEAFYLIHLIINKRFSTFRGKGIPFQEHGSSKVSGLLSGKANVKAPVYSDSDLSVIYTV